MSVYVVIISVVTLAFDLLYPRGFSLRRLAILTSVAQTDE